MYETDVKHTSEVVQTLSCELELVKVSVEVKDNKVTQATLFLVLRTENLWVNMGEEALKQLHTAVGKVLQRLEDKGIIAT